MRLTFNIKKRIDVKRDLIERKTYRVGVIWSSHSRKRRLISFGRERGPSWKSRLMRGTVFPSSLQMRASLHPAIRSTWARVGWAHVRLARVSEIFTPNVFSKASREDGISSRFATLTHVEEWSPCVSIPPSRSQSGPNAGYKKSMVSRIDRRRLDDPNIAQLRSL